MQDMKCSWCKQILTDKMEIEYSADMCEFYCCPDCATSSYYERLRSRVLDLTDTEFFENHGIKIIKGKLKKEDLW